MTNRTQVAGQPPALRRVEHRERTADGQLVARAPLASRAHHVRLGEQVQQLGAPVGLEPAPLDQAAALHVVDHLHDAGAADPEDPGRARPAGSGRRRRARSGTPCGGARSASGASAAEKSRCIRKCTRVTRKRHALQQRSRACPGRGRAVDDPDQQSGGAPRARRAVKTAVRASSRSSTCRRQRRAAAAPSAVRVSA